MSAAVELFDLHADGTPPADPLTLAREWLPADDEPDRPQVTLGTLGTDGCPDARTVLLTAFDETGFAFHTSAASRKVAELAALPRASMVVLWPGFTRQLVLRGEVVPDAAESVAAAWAARSDHLRRLAWCNTDELAALNRDERLRRWAAAPVGPLRTQAPSWVGYRLQPVELTFWAGGVDSASRRLQYPRTADGWRWRHLAG
ncbi:Pyridoxine/pyridoxamine 5'-phosphate oxidase [Modestobacter italicus]|uniref:Pyridoxine/pyridoxamine 5'-phosphate oxidase n=1 Tax=Modestobacter italicus (strain DSM 44449 / CECT 9708 / BC 501) TaxID=2732864 RepID=I4EU69_MODI5|nr:pyridoxamine 5'-phosphate oxidase family protein [Modestobacter marinus]CCH86932.1 Pyridoxine/pyridoxamine 5'-phosphate oxidase [Modestobacter marinus]